MVFCFNYLAQNHHYHHFLRHQQPHACEHLTCFPLASTDQVLDHMLLQNQVLKCHHILQQHTVSLQELQQQHIDVDDSWKQQTSILLWWHHSIQHWVQWKKRWFLSNLNNTKLKKKLKLVPSDPYSVHHLFQILKWVMLPSFGMIFVSCRCKIREDIQQSPDNSNSDNSNSPLTWTKSSFSWILRHFSVIFIRLIGTRLTQIPC